MIPNKAGYNSVCRLIHNTNVGNSQWTLRPVTQFLCISSHSKNEKE